MKLISKIAIIMLCTVSLFMACGGKRTAKLGNNKAFTPNMSIYYLPIEQVWDALLKTVQYDFLYTIIVKNKRDWVFFHRHCS